MRLSGMAVVLAALSLAGCVAPARTDAATAAASPEDALRASVRREAEFMLSLQHASGAFNDVPGAPSWVVPRENGVAILGLLRAAAFLGGEEAERYRAAAERAADWLVAAQRADGAWADQYDHGSPVTRASSPTQAAEVAIALAALPATPERDRAIARAAEWLLDAREEDGLVNGGLDEGGEWRREWRWASDNAFAALALRGAAARSGDARFGDAADAIERGLATTMKDPASPAWHARVDGRGVPAADPAEWISYAPAFVGLAPSTPALRDWVDQVLGDESGAARWASDGPRAARLSPGFSFQACAVWDRARCERAIAWAESSGLAHPEGGWIDWVEPDGRAPAWQRFVDTSAYAIAARLGERPFDAPARDGF